MLLQTSATDHEDYDGKKQVQPNNNTHTHDILSPKHPRNHPNPLDSRDVELEILGYDRIDRINRGKNNFRQYEYVNADEDDTHRIRTDGHNHRQKLPSIDYEIAEKDEQYRYNYTPNMSTQSLIKHAQNRK